MKNRFRYKPLLTALCLAGAALVTSTVYAVHDDGNFELGPVGSTVTDILGDHPNNEVDSNGPDWGNLFDANRLVVSGALATYGGLAATFVKDDLATKGLVDHTVFVGSNKNNDAIATWQWDTGNVPAKDDIANAYAYAKVVAGTQTPDKLLIYAGIERLDPSGDSHVDIEFNQLQVGLDEAPPCSDSSCSFTGAKSVNDIVVSMDFLNGGAIGEVSIHRWDGNEYVPVYTLSGEGCNDEDGLPPDVVCAFNNADTIPKGPWPTFGKGGAPVNSLLTNAFTEFGADVTTLLDLAEAPCYASINVKTRSSQSFTAELKDFAVAKFENCTASVVTQIHSGDSVGATHDATDIQNTTVPVLSLIHDKAVVTGVEGLPTPSGTITFNRYTTSDCTGTPDIQSDVALTTVTSLTAATESETFQPSNGGGAISYLAHYSGDDTYPASDAPCETLSLSKYNSTVTTDIIDAQSSTSVLNKAVDSGTSVRDVATVHGNGTDVPSGTVNFVLFETATCTGASTTSAPVALGDDENAEKTASATSDPFTTVKGTFRSYVVIYNGDGVYSGSAATLCEPICSFEFDPLVPEPSN